MGVGDARGYLGLFLLQGNTRGDHLLRGNGTGKTNVLGFVGVPGAHRQGALFPNLDIRLGIGRQAFCGVFHNTVCETDKERERRGADAREIEVIAPVRGVLLIHVVDAAGEVDAVIHDIASPLQFGGEHVMLTDVVDDEEIIGQGVGEIKGVFLVDLATAQNQVGGAAADLPTQVGDDVEHIHLVAVLGFLLEVEIVGQAIGNG